MRVYDIEIDDENVRNLINILHSAVNLHKSLLKDGTVIHKVTNEKRVTEVLGAATFILDSVLAQTGYQIVK